MPALSMICACENIEQTLQPYSLTPFTAQMPSSNFAPLIHFLLPISPVLQAGGGG